jgi:hypothetical protein
MVMAYPDEDDMTDPDPAEEIDAVDTKDWT